MTVLVKGGAPIYYPTSVNASVGGQIHTFSYYRGYTGGISLHPLQRSGQVGAVAHTMAPAQAAPSPAGRALGSPLYPAAKVNMVLPPVVATVGGPRDGNFQV